MNKIWKFCEDCHVKLTDENRWGGDKYAGFCQTCWDKRMEDDSVKIAVGLWNKTSLIFGGYIVLFVSRKHGLGMKG